MFKKLDLPKIVAELPQDVKDVYLEFNSNDYYGNFCVLTGSRMLKGYGLLNREPNDYDICIVSSNSDFEDDPGECCQDFEDITYTVCRELRKRGFEIVKWYSLEQDAENSYDDFSFICKAKKNDIVLDVLFRVESGGDNFEEFESFSGGVFNGKNTIEGVFDLDTISNCNKYRFLHEKGRYWSDNCFIFDTPHQILKEKWDIMKSSRKHSDDIEFITNKLKDKVKVTVFNRNHGIFKRTIDAIEESYNLKC